MRRRRLLWQLFPSYLLIMLLSLTSVAWYASRSLRHFYLDQTAAQLQTTARLVEEELPHPLGQESDAALEAISKKLAAAGNSRITLILPSGKVVGDSQDDPRQMENHADRPEVIEALAGRAGVSTRYSNTLQERMMYVAVPLVENGNVVAAVRAALSTHSIDQRLRGIYFKIGFGGFIIALITGAISLIISRAFSRPLEEIRRGVDRFAAGEFTYKLPIPRTEEFGGVAEAMNRMAAQLDDRIRAVLRQRNELEGVLSSMVEGVLAFDAEEQLININQAAAALIGVKSEEVLGRTIQEAVRNPDLQQFVARALHSPVPVEGDIILHGSESKFLQAHGTVLHDAQGRSFGALVVLNDVTRLRSLENVRRDFVANVSHELKTPVTSIKGFAETLLEGALNNPEEARRFIEIIARHAERLHAIIEDLLTLSRLEQEEQDKEIEIEEGRLKDVLGSAIQDCAIKAQAKDIRIDLQCDDALQLQMNAPLLEQAVMNLIDNAIKYSEAGSAVEIRGERRDSEILISVADHGCGIEKEHLPRIFERFYRVDQARSRKQGGTGLGLAIVKHIVQAHHGRISVESSPGNGSVFSVYLPVI